VVSILRCHFLLYDVDSPMAKKFCLRFQIPFPSYLELVELIKADDRLEQWCGFKKFKQTTSPIGLLVLGSLGYFGRGWMFDDIEGNTAISREVHRAFFHIFINFGSTVLHDKFVQTPVNLDEAKSNIVEYAESGLPGCIGSSDCTHILTQGCEYNLKNNHTGGTSRNTTCTFNLMCNHRRHILYTSIGGPGCWNNQTMVCLDNFISDIYDGLILSYNEFNLVLYDSNKNRVQMTYTGVYVIVDNGYLPWSCTVPPFLMTNKINETRWLKWIESMRRDIECAFGILKGRWRILKSSVRISDVVNVDKV
jgi:hypothetical protein